MKCAGPAGASCSAYLLVAHYTQLLRFVQVPARGSMAMGGRRGGRMRNVRAFGYRAQREAALLVELGETPGPLGS